MIQAKQLCRYRVFDSSAI